MADVPTDVEAQSTIESVTVFESGAQIFRISSLAVPKGVSRIVFRDLPQTLQRDTLQVAVRPVAGSDLTGLVLKGIGMETVSKENPDYHSSQEKGQEVGQATKQLEAKLQNLQDRLSLSTSSTSFMDSMWDKASKPNAQAETEDLFDVAKWSALISQRVQFTETNAAEQRSLNEEITATREQLDVLRAQARSYSATRSYITNEVITVVLCSAAAIPTLQLQLSYMISEAKWTPAYDIRVQSVRSTVAIQYNATVEQWSAENWPSIRLDLSTAKPHLSSMQPTLSPWHISLYKPSPVPESRECDAVCFEARSSSLGGRLRLQSERPAAPMAIQSAEVTEQATSQVFTVAGIHSVVNGRKVLRVSLVQFDVPAAFSYVTVPAAAEVAFGIAKVTNTSDYFLLPGPTSVFMNEQYLARSTLARVSPGETFSVDVGRDDGVVVSRKAVKRMKSEEGNVLTGKKIKHDCQYFIKVTNRKAMAVDVEVKEAIPMSGNAAIVVKLLQPEFPEGEREIPHHRFDEMGVLHYNATVQPGADATLSVIYRLSYPDDGQIVDGF